jgi:hypothetical protein
LLFDDPDHPDVAGLLPFLCCFVPPGHVDAAAGSPGGKNVQDDLVAADPAKPADKATLASRTAAEKIPAVLVR